jgi:hypothetical protein
MPATYDKIASQTLGSNQATVTFSSIAGTYTDLVLIANIKHSFGTTGDVIVDGLQFNSDTGTNYSKTNLQGNGTTAASDRGSNMTGISYVATRSSESYFATNIINIQNYSNTTTNKTVLLRGAGNGTSVGTNAQVGLWRNTAAITSVTINATSSFTIQSGSTFTLYGIKAA